MTHTSKLNFDFKNLNYMTDNRKVSYKVANNFEMLNYIKIYTVRSKINNLVCDFVLYNENDLKCLINR